MLSWAQRSASRMAAWRFMPMARLPRTNCASLLDEAGRHFRRMAVDYVATVVAFHGSARVGYDIGGGDQTPSLIFGELVVGDFGVTDEAGHGGGEFGSHRRFRTGIANRLHARPATAYGAV